MRFVMMVQLQNKYSCKTRHTTVVPEQCGHAEIDSLYTACLFQTAPVRFAGNALGWRHGSVRYAALFRNSNGNPREAHWE